VYAEFKPKETKRTRGSQAIATQKLILPLLQKSDEPAVEALGNLHLVSEDHFADLAIGIQTAMAMSGGELPEPKRKSRMRKPKKKALVAMVKLQSNNLASRIDNRIDVMNHAAELGVHLPIARSATPKSKKDGAKKRQQSPYDPTKVFCGDHLLCATQEVNEALARICPGRFGMFSPDDLEHAHTWAICDQRKNGIWGSDTCHDVHMLQKKCHKKVDQMLLKSQAAERRAEAAKARAGDTTKKRTYTEIDESDADEQEDEERGRGARSCS
jgi:hypothetical protein